MLVIPEQLAATPKHRAWLEQLPHPIREMLGKWWLVLGAPIDGKDVSAAG